MTRNQRGVVRFLTQERLEGWKICKDHSTGWPAYEKEDFGLDFLQRKCKYLDTSNIVVSHNISNTTPAMKEMKTPSDFNQRCEDYKLASDVEAKCEHLSKPNAPQRCTFKYVQVSPARKEHHSARSNAIERVKRLIYLANAGSRHGSQTTEAFHVPEDATAIGSPSHNAQAEKPPVVRLSEAKGLSIKAAVNNDYQRPIMSMTYSNFREDIAKLRQQQMNKVSSQEKSCSEQSISFQQIGEQMQDMSQGPYRRKSRGDVSSPSTGSGKGRPTSEGLPRVFISRSLAQPLPAEPANTTGRNGIQAPRLHKSVWSQRKCPGKGPGEGQAKAGSASVITFVGKENEPQAPKPLSMPAFHPYPIKVPAQHSANSLRTQSKKGQRHGSADKCKTNQTFPTVQPSENDGVATSEGDMTLGDVLHAIKEDGKWKPIPAKFGRSKI